MAGVCFSSSAVITLDAFSLLTFGGFVRRFQDTSVRVRESVSSLSLGCASAQVCLPL